MDPLTTWHVHCGEALAVLQTLPAASVQCVVTSPPYWGLRDYGVAHQVGLEDTPDAFVARLVEIFREVRRVLRDDGVVWLNLGDSYANTGFTGSIETNGGFQGARQREVGHQFDSPRKAIPDGIKPKDLIGIPWMVAFALRADGWYLRADVIWAKRNCMPESITDRPTKAHEYVFLLSKAARYFYDAAAIRNPYARLWNETNGGSLAPEHADEAAARAGRAHNGNAHRGPYPLPRVSAKGAGTPRNDGDRWRTVDGGVAARGEGANARSVWNFDAEADAAFALTAPDATAPREVYTGQATKDYDAAGAQNPSDTKRRVLDTMAAPDYAGANARSVWALATECSPYEHFAVMPRALVRKCLLAGTSAVGQCPACGTPWTRVQEKLSTGVSHVVGKTAAKHAANPHLRTGFSGYDDGSNGPVFKTVGWQPACACPPHAPVPQTVLDPFAGVATTGVVALQEGRSFVGIELNPKYHALARARLTGTMPLFSGEQDATVGHVQPSLAETDETDEIEVE